MRRLALFLLAALPAPSLAHEFALGDLVVGHPFSLADSSEAGRGYLTVTNNGAEADALLAVEAPFPQVSLHRAADTPPVERLPIGAGETLTLAPGAHHIAFEGLEEALVAGDAIPATLVFEKAGRLEVEFVVEEAASGTIVAGDLTLSGAFSRATLPGAPVAAGYLRVANGGAEGDRLVSASTDAAGETQIHEMATVDDVMRMRPLPGGLPIPAGATVDLSPGGTHLMLMDLRGPLVEGATVDVTLTFERAGTVVVPLAIGAPDADGAAHGEDH